MKNINACLSHNHDNWATPKIIYDYFIKEHNFLDPCPLYCEENCLNNEYNENLFINPPYSNIKEFVNFAIHNHKKFNKIIVLLIPSRTDTKYFSTLYEYGCKFYFVKGRLSFNDTGKSAPFPSVFVLLDGKGISTMSIIDKTFIK